MIRGNWFRRMSLAVQVVALATACAAEQTGPATTATPMLLAISPAPGTATPASLRRWSLPDLRAWDVEANELLYVAESAPGTLRLLDLGSGAETSVAIPEGRQIASAVILRDGIAYVAAVGSDRRRPSAFEVRHYGIRTQQDQLLDTITPATEPGQDAPLAPGLITGRDRTALVWSRYEASAEVFETELRQRRSLDGAADSALRARGVVFPIAVAGRDLVIWKRAAGAGDSYTATDTYVVSGGQERLLLEGAWPLDVATDGRVVFHRGGTAEIRAGLTGAVLMDVSLGTEGPGVIFPPRIAGRRIAWCSEQGVLSVLEFDRLTTQRYTADGCASRIYLDETAVTWLEADPGKFALVRLQLP